MEANINEVGSLLIMLQLLGKFGVTDSMLNRKYGLNRASLNSIRKGGRLRNSYDHYFRMLLRELEYQRQICKLKVDVDNHRLIKDAMFWVMSREFGILEENSVKIEFSFFVV